MYIKGEGIEQNHQQAYAWLAVAADNGHNQAAKIIERISAQMKPNTLAGAQDLARQYSLRYNKQ